MKGSSGIWELASARAGLDPSRALAIDEWGKTLTFGDYIKRCEQLSGVLAAHGVAEGTVVSWCMPTTIDAAVLVGALARLGVVQNPLLPSYGAREIEFIVGQTGARFLLVSPPRRGADLPAVARDIATRHPGLEVIELTESLFDRQADHVPPAARPGSDDVERWIFYTSGTTGTPRGARHADASLIASATGMAERIGVGADDCNSMVFPFTHVGGVIWLVVSFLSGASNIFVTDFDPVETPRVLSAAGATLVGSGSAFLVSYVQAARTATEPLFPAGRVFLAGGAPKPDGLAHALEGAFGAIPLLSGYGMTEAPLVAFSAERDSATRRSITEGRPSPGAAMRVVSLDGRPCAAGEAGELRIKGQQVMLGYVDATLDADAFDEEGWFRSGDLGYLDEEGYVVVTGRLKDVIIRKGENISAKEIEDLLYEHPRIADVAVIGLPHPDLGEMCCAVCVLTEPTDSLELSDIVEHLLTYKIMKQKLPERLEVVAALPRNTSGKVLKGELRERWS